jgi:hypothetical protein
VHVTEGHDCALNQFSSGTPLRPINSPEPTRKNTIPTSFNTQPDAAVDFDLEIARMRFLLDEYDTAATRTMQGKP